MTNFARPAITASQSVSHAGTDAPPTPTAVRRRTQWLRRARGSSPLLMSGVLGALVIFFVVERPGPFTSLVNVQNIFSDVSVLMVMAVGMTFVMVAAGLDLSIGSVLVLASVAAAKAMSAMGTDNSGTILVGLAVAVVTGLACGVFNGMCITRLRVPALITTLGTLGAILGLADLVTNGADVRDVPLTMVRLTTARLFGLSYIVWVAVAVSVVAGLVLGLTRFGRLTYIIGSNAEAARRAGINVNRHLLKLYALSGALAGLAGMLSLIRYDTTTVGSHGTDSLAVITGVILGGTSLFGGMGTIFGTAIGMLIPVVINRGLVMLNVNPFWQQIVIGLILIVAVYLDQLKRHRRQQT